MASEMHRFQSYTFPRSAFHQTVQALEVTPTKTVPKDAFFKRHSDRSGGVFAYSFGALTFWNMTPDEIKAFFTKMDTVFQERGYKLIESDDYQVEENPSLRPHVEFNKLVLDELTDKRAEVVALTLGQSVTMSYYEQQVSTITDSVNKLVDQLRRRGNVGPAPTKFHRIIAESVSARNNVIGILHLLDKPDIIWDDSTMDSLYSDLRSSFDLEERFRALEYKLGAIQDTMELLIDMARDSRLFLLEVAIVIMIAIEIGLTLFKL